MSTGAREDILDFFLCTRESSVNPPTHPKNRTTTKKTKPQTRQRTAARVLLLEAPNQNQGSIFLCSLFLSRLPPIQMKSKQRSVVRWTATAVTLVGMVPLVRAYTISTRSPRTASHRHASSFGSNYLDAIGKDPQPNRGWDWGPPDAAAAAAFADSQPLERTGLDNPMAFPQNGFEQHQQPYPFSDPQYFHRAHDHGNAPNHDQDDRYFDEAVAYATDNYHRDATQDEAERFATAETVYSLPFDYMGAIRNAPPFHWYIYTEDDDDDDDGGFHIHRNHTTHPGMTMRLTPLPPPLLCHCKWIRGSRKNPVQPRLPTGSRPLDTTTAG